MIIDCCVKDSLIADVYTIEPSSNTYEPIKKAYIKHHFDPVTQQKLLTQVTAKPIRPIPQPTQSINLKNYLLNGPSTTPTVAQLNGLHNSQSREILQKVLMNDKVHIKQITTETNQAQPNIKTTIINTSTPKIDVLSHESMLQQHNNGSIKRTRSSRPATVNQLLSNNQIKALNLCKSGENPSQPVTPTTTTQITLINKQTNDNTNVSQILVKHQASTTNNINSAKCMGNNVLVSSMQSNETIYQTFKNGFKSTNGQFTNNFKFNLNSTNPNHLTQAISQSMQILTKQKSTNIDETK
jgi:hypothetical protein